jgi:hypothetical protein
MSRSSSTHRLLPLALVAGAALAWAPRAAAAHGPSHEWLG